MATEDEPAVYHREIPKEACEKLLDPGCYLMRKTPPEESEQQPQVQLVYRSRLDSDVEGNLLLKFLNLSQSDGTYHLGEQKLQTMREVALLLTGWRTPDGTTLKTAERRKAFELNGDQFVVDTISRPLGLGEQADAIRLGRISGRTEEVALKQHSTISSAWREFLAASAAQGPGVVPVLGVSVDSARPIIALKAYKERYGLNNFMHEGETETLPLLKLLTKLARTIGQVHERKVAHLDLKIPNIMVDRATGEWVVIDFGLAKTEAQPEHFRQDVANFCAYIVDPLLHRDEKFRAVILAETSSCENFDQIAAIFSRYTRNAPL